MSRYGKHRPRAKRARRVCARAVLLDLVVEWASIRRKSRSSLASGSVLNRTVPCVVPPECTCSRCALTVYCAGHARRASPYCIGAVQVGVDTRDVITFGTDKCHNFDNTGQSAWVTCSASQWTAQFYPGVQFNGNVCDAEPHQLAVPYAVVVGVSGECKSYSIMTSANTYATSSVRVYC